MGNNITVPWKLKSYTLIWSIRFPHSGLLGFQAKQLKNSEFNEVVFKIDGLAKTYWLGKQSDGIFKYFSGDFSS